ncbi:MAG: glycoside hydrolase family 2 TIM barrel-domain containing protein [Bacteroidota bacterium]
MTNKLSFRHIIFFLIANVLYGQVATLKNTLTIETVSSISVPYQNGIPVPSFEKQQRVTRSLAGSWKKNRFSANHDLTLLKRDSAGYAQLLAEAADRQSPYFDDSSWPLHTIPGVENKMNAIEKTPEYYENGVWYRTSFTVADSLAQKFARLNFYAVNYVADVWLNGKYLGWHEGGYTPFSFDISSALRFDSANVLVVRVDNVPWGSRPKNDIVPFYKCDWFNYTGIIHDVYLEFADKVSVVRANAVPQNIDGTVQSTIVVNNAFASSQNVDVTLRVYEAKTDSLSLTKEITADLIGNEVNVSGTTNNSLSLLADSIGVWRTNIQISNPKVWSPLHPNLYILKVTVSQNGVVKDEFFTQFGVRTIKAVEDKIYLNEMPVFLHGVARHEDHPIYGRSLPISQIVFDLQTVKRVNANYLRSGHYPNHPFTYLAADRYGLMVMEEIPVWWFDGTIEWLIQNDGRRIHLQMFREMVFRDYNRPSIALWSTSNECKDVGGREKFLSMVQADLDVKYPDGRLITQSAAADRPGPFDNSQSFTDVAGWTMYFGIFYNPYGFGITRGTKYFMVDAHDYFPTKPIIATEYGYWSGESMTQFDKQVMIFDSTYLAFAPRMAITSNGRLNSSGFIAGITWWCIFDWYSHQQAFGFQSMGLIRMNRDFDKPVMTKLQTTYGKYADKSEYLTSVVKTESPVATEFALDQNYPNPFNPSTTVRFSLARPEHVQMKVYDVLGNEITTLVNSKIDAGTHSVEWNARTVASGIYFCRITAGNYSATRKMTLLK